MKQTFARIPRSLIALETGTHSPWVSRLLRELAEELSVELREALEPLLAEVESLNERIKEYDARMEKIATESYPQVALLKQVKGVGTQIALTYVLTLEDPHRFPKSREVGCF